MQPHPLVPPASLRLSAGMHRGMKGTRNFMALLHRRHVPTCVYYLEGIMAKRRDAPCRSDTRSGWIKAKTPEWKAANQYRARLFEKRVGRLR